MVLLRRPVIAYRQYLGDDRALVDAAVLQFAHHLHSHLRLRSVAGVDAAAVLGSGIVALAVKRSGVMDHEEDFQDFTQADLVRIECQAHDLVVARIARANLLVAGIFYMAIAVAGLHIRDALYLLKDRFSAPKTAATQRNNLARFIHLRLLQNIHCAAS